MAYRYEYFMDEPRGYAAGRHNNNVRRRSLHDLHESRSHGVTMEHTTGCLIVTQGYG